MDVPDIRGRRVAYVNHCLLNQNTRFPGVAVRKEAFSELAQILLGEGIGIEQLPCMESIGLGGVSRKTFDRFLPLLSRSIAGGYFPILRPAFKAWLFRYQRLCRREATRVAGRIEDYCVARLRLLHGHQADGVNGSAFSPSHAEAAIFKPEDSVGPDPVGRREGQVPMFSA